MNDPGVLLHWWVHPLKPSEHSSMSKIDSLFSKQWNCCGFMEDFLGNSYQFLDFQNSFSVAEF